MHSSMSVQQTAHTQMKQYVMYQFVVYIEGQQEYGHDYNNTCTINLCHFEVIECAA